MASGIKPLAIFFALSTTGFDPAAWEIAPRVRIKLEMRTIRVFTNLLCEQTPCRFVANYQILVKLLNSVCPFCFEGNSAKL